MNEYLILTFNGIVNVSLSVGDKVYFTGNIGTSGGFDTSDNLVGYYGKVRLSNDSEVKAELFAASMDVSQSSK